MKCRKIWGANLFWKHLSWWTKPKVKKILRRSKSSTQLKKGLIECHQSRHKNTTKILLNPFDQPLIDIYQIWRGTLIRFEGGVIKAATPFLVGNWKKNYRKDLHCQQIWKTLTNHTHIWFTKEIKLPLWQLESCSLRFRFRILLSMQFLTRGLEFQWQPLTSYFFEPTWWFYRSFKKFCVLPGNSFEVSNMVPVSYTHLTLPTICSV